MRKREERETPRNYTHTIRLFMGKAAVSKIESSSKHRPLSLQSEVGLEKSGELEREARAGRRGERGQLTDWEKIGPRRRKRGTD